MWSVSLNCERDGVITIELLDGAATFALPQRYSTTPSRAGALRNLGWIQVELLMNPWRGLRAHAGRGLSYNHSIAAKPHISCNL